VPFFSFFGPPNIRKMKARRDILGLVRVFATCKAWRYMAAADELLKIADASASGTTPLHLAAQEGHKDVVELLLAKGADINAEDNHGQTAFHWAVLDGRKDVAQLLRQHGGHE
jgi:hypothetical protein